MTVARWVALLLLILSITSCMWLVAAVAVNLFVPDVMPNNGLRPSEIALGGVICLIGPAMLAVASGMIWFFGIYKRAVPDVPPATSQPRNDPRTAMQGGVEDYLEQLTALIFAAVADTTYSDAQIAQTLYAQTRLALAHPDPARPARVCQLLHSAQVLGIISTIDLHELDLRGADLRYIDLHNADLTGTRLAYAQLAGANLKEADLSRANLEEADLRLACLDRACLKHANLQRTRFQRASLREAVLDNADLRDANLWEADLSNTSISPEQLRLARAPVSNSATNIY